MSNGTVIDIQGIIDEVARRHNIRLAPDDPILATVTVTDVVHKLFAEHLRRITEGVANNATDRLVAQIETGRREIEHQTETAKGIASKLVNDAGSWSASQLRQASAGAAEDIQRSVTTALATIQSDIQIVSAAKRAAIWAAMLAIVLGGAFLGGGIGFWLAGS